MGTLNPMMVRKILNEFDQDPSYTRVAKKLKIDRRTVKKCIDNQNKIVSSKLEDNAKSNQEAHKLIYEGLMHGNSPGKIIAETGIDPVFVQTENKRYHEMNSTDSYALQEKIFSYLELYQEYIPRFKYWSDLRKQNGLLKNDEVIQILRFIARIAFSKDRVKSNRPAMSSLKGELVELRSERSERRSKLHSMVIDLDH